MEKEIGLFVKEIKKRTKDKDKDGNEIIEKKYFLKTHSVCSIKLSEILYDKMAFSVVTEWWYLFDGVYWKRCEDGEADTKFYTIFNLETSGPNELELGYQVSFYNGVIELVKKHQKTKLPQVSENFINFTNGVLDLDKIGIKDCFAIATPKNSQSWFIPYDYKPTAWCPSFLNWLENVLPDKELINFIRAFFNAVIKRRSDLQYFVHFKGEPRAGKGTLVKVLKSIISTDDIVSSSLKILATSLFEPGRLWGKSLLILDEEKSFNDLSMLKKITGRDTMTVRLKHGNLSVDYEPGCQVIIVSNPDLSLSQDDAGAISWRSRPISFNQSFSAEKQIKWLEAGGEKKLLEEAPGILNWALELSDQEVTKMIMNPPKIMSETNLDAEISGNGLTRWIMEYLTLASSETDKVYIGDGTPVMLNGRMRFGNNPDTDETTKLYPHYRAYCLAECIEKVLPANKFSLAVISTSNRLWETDKIRKSKRDSSGYAIENIRFKTEIELIYN